MTLEKRPGTVIDTLGSSYRKVPVRILTHSARCIVWLRYSGYRLINGAVRRRQNRKNRQKLHLGGPEPPNFMTLEKLRGTHIDALDSAYRMMPVQWL